MTFNEHTTGLHEAIEDPAERQDAIDQTIFTHALAGDRGADQKRIAEEVARWGAMLLRKNRDYGSSVWKPPVLAPHLSPGDAIRVRMSDKVERLISLAEKGSPEVAESIEDTELDFAAYVLLKRAMPVEDVKESVAPCDGVRWFWQQDTKQLRAIRGDSCIQAFCFRDKDLFDSGLGRTFCERNSPSYVELTTEEALQRLKDSDWPEGVAEARKLAGLPEETVSEGVRWYLDRVLIRGYRGGENIMFGLIKRNIETTVMDEGSCKLDNDTPMTTEEVIAKLGDWEEGIAAAKEFAGVVEEPAEEVFFSLGEWVKLNGEFMCIHNIPSVGRVELSGKPYMYSCPVDGLEKLPKIGEWQDGPGQGNDYQLPVGTEFEIELRPGVVKAFVDCGNEDKDGLTSNATWITVDGDQTRVWDFANHKFRVTKYPPCPVVDTPDPGEGWRLVDKEKDEPQEGDEYWCSIKRRWYDRAYVTGWFDGYHYRRRDYTQWQEPVGRGGKYPVPVGTRIEFKHLSDIEAVIKDEWPKERTNAFVPEWGTFILGWADYPWRVIEEA